MTCLLTVTPMHPSEGMGDSSQVGAIEGTGLVPGGGGVGGLGGMQTSSSGMGTLLLNTVVQSSHWACVVVRMRQAPSTNCSK